MGYFSRKRDKISKTSSLLTILNPLSRNPGSAPLGWFESAFNCGEHTVALRRILALESCVPLLARRVSFALKERERGGGGSVYFLSLNFFLKKIRPKNHLYLEYLICHVM